MRKIQFTNAAGMSKSLSPLSDVLAGLVFYLTIIGGLILPLFPISWITALACFYGYGKWSSAKLRKRLASDQYVALSRDETLQFPAFIDMIHQYDLKPIPLIYVDVSDLNLAGEAKRLNRGDILIISAGLLAEIGLETEKSKAILAHELAHIANKDWILLHILQNNKVVFWLVGVLLFFEMMSNPKWAGLSIVAAGIGLYTQVAAHRHLIRRREYFADASAINLLSDTNTYINLLRNGLLTETPYHPTPEQRIKALKVASPISRPSKLIVSTTIFCVISVLFGGFSVAVAADDYFTNARAIVPIILILGACGAIPLVFVVLIDLIKPWKRMVPSVLNDGNRNE